METGALKSEHAAPTLAARPSRTTGSAAAAADSDRGTPLECRDAAEGADVQGHTNTGCGTA